MSGRKMPLPSKDVHIIIPGTSEYATPHGKKKKEFRWRMELKLPITWSYNREILLHCSVGPNATQGSLKVVTEAEDTASE